MTAKISELGAAGTLDGTEKLEVTKAGASKRTTAQAIANLFVTGSPDEGDSLVFSGGQWVPGAGGGGGSASTLVDATSGDVSLTADNDALTISDDIDFVSHGKLDTDHGFTPVGGEGQLPTWYDPANTQFDQGGWFAFGYDNAIGRVSQHWGSGPSEGVNVITDQNVNQLNVFARVDATDEATFNTWDEAGNIATNVLQNQGVYNQINTWDPSTGTQGAWIMTFANAGPAGLVGNVGSLGTLLVDATGAVVLTAHTSAPGDALLADAEQNFGSGAGGVVTWLDVAGNKLKFRVVYPDGSTFKTGEVALT